MDRNSVIVKNYLNVFEEIEAAGVIYPGHLLELNTDGKVVVHDSPEGNVVPPMFAVEDSFQGKGMNDAYASGDQVRVWIPQSGDIVYAILSDDETVEIGDFLESNGDGCLQKHVADVDSSADITTVYGSAIVGVAIEARDLTTSSLVDSYDDAYSQNKRIKVRIR
jgi:hypothetical protein